MAGTGNLDGSRNTLATGGTVTLNGVAFSNDGAVGGAGAGGGYGGGGGMGGNGGAGGDGAQNSPLGAGGGIGAAASGASGFSAPGGGIVLGAAGGGAGNALPQPGGPFGGGGAGGYGTLVGSEPAVLEGVAGGGGVGGASGEFLRGGDGGFGGGGGSMVGVGGGPPFSGGGNGGFGGGGASGLNGGVGGFGGGGGGGFGQFSGGFGGGFGTGSFGTFAGGGGLGAGGDIFVQQGGSLTVEGGSLSGGFVQGGATGGSLAGGNGEGLGSGIFLQGNEAITLSPPVGQTQTISDVITDQTGSGGSGANAGAGSVVIAPGSTVELTGADNYTGGTTLESGAVLQVGNGSIGSLAGPVVFPGDPATLVLDGTQAIEGLGAIFGFATGSAIDLVGETFATANLRYDATTEKLTIDASGGTFTLGFAGHGPAANFVAVPLADSTAIEVAGGTGGTPYISETDGDWSSATIWSTDSVPDSVTADVTIDTTVTVSAGESFTAGTLDVGSPGILDLLGSLDVTAGATVDGGMLLMGGSLSVGAGLTLTTKSSSLGVSGTVSGSIDNGGLIYAANGLLDLTGPVGGTGPLEVDLATGHSATLELGQGGSEAVAFVGLDPLSSARGVLKLDQPSGYSGTISGFTFGEAIDLTGLAPGALTESFSGNAAHGTLTIANGTSTVASLNFAGDYTHSTFTLVPDAQGGTDVEIVPPASETATVSGDWGKPAIWDLGLVPNNRVTHAIISAGISVSIAAAESFVAGGVHIQGLANTGINLDAVGSLTVAGALAIDASGTLLIGAPFDNTISGFVEARTIDVAVGGRIEGNGTLGSSGTLTNDGSIGATFATLTLAPAVYQGGISGFVSGVLFVDHGVLVLAPTTGAAGFANLMNGTLSGGIYEAIQGTLVLPGPVNDIENAFVSLEGFNSQPTIETGGTPIEDTLGMIGSGAGLSVSYYDYVSPNTLTVADSSIDLFQATLSPADLILATGSSELSGIGTVSSDIANSGRILAAAPLFGSFTPVLDLAGSVSGGGSLEIAIDSTLELGQGNTEALTFDPLPQSSPGQTPAVLQLDDPAAYAGIISGFTATSSLSDIIDLPGFAPGTLGDIYNGNTAGGVLDVLAPGSIVASLTFVGDYTQDSFTLVSDGKGGTDIELVGPGGLVPCFARRTRIATTRGEVSVEDLRVGHCALTAAGDARPIVWIGDRVVDCRRHPHPELVWPVRIRPGAFGAGEPQRDLWLSPDHAVYVGTAFPHPGPLPKGEGAGAAFPLPLGEGQGEGGALIPVKYLINGASIVQEPVDTVHYFHVQFSCHDILLAEGLPAESYLDTGNRAQFANGGAAIALHPDFAPRSWDDACAPLVTEGAAVLAVRQRILARLPELGFARSEPKFQIRAGGRVIHPLTVGHQRYRYLLPSGTRAVRIISSSAVPAGLDLANSDCRRLGARIGAVFMDERFVPLDAPRFAEGFYPSEQKGAEVWRWTDGRARLALPRRDGRPISLELLVRDVMADWRCPKGTPKATRAANRDRSQPGRRFDRALRA